MTRIGPPLLLVVAPLLLMAAAKPPKGAEPPKAAPVKPGRPSGPLATAAGAQAPLPAGEKAAWSHGPYVDGNCAICHESKDPKKPGAVTPSGNELCFGCHEEFVGIMANRPHKHAAAAENCLNCHNAHNAREKKLLHAEVRVLCRSCHEKTSREIEAAKVKHQAVERDGKCLNCHNAHAANVEALLVKLPYDLCIACHDKDDVTDEQGRKLTNIKKLVAGAKFLHAPVASKDCSACHEAHGGEHFRLLREPYPEKFYAPYERQNYALCFECHNDDIMKDEQTTTLTRFRDGSRNLHYLHVNKPDRGRTCRACHEVHAAAQPHIIRDAVPYGPRGWMLEVNFTPTPTGGVCTKTCHSAKEYAHRSGDGAPKSKPDRKK